MSAVLHRTPERNSKLIKQQPTATGAQKATNRRTYIRRQNPNDILSFAITLRHVHAHSSSAEANFDSRTKLAGTQKDRETPGNDERSASAPPSQRLHGASFSHSAGNLKSHPGPAPGRRRQVARRWRSRSLRVRPRRRGVHGALLMLSTTMVLLLLLWFRGGGRGS